MKSPIYITYYLLLLKLSMNRGIEDEVNLKKSNQASLKAQSQNSGQVNNQNTQSKPKQKETCMLKIDIQIMGLYLKGGKIMPFSNINENFIKQIKLNENTIALIRLFGKNNYLNERNSQGIFNSFNSKDGYFYLTTKVAKLGNIFEKETKDRYKIVVSIENAGIKYYPKQSRFELNLKIFDVWVQISAIGTKENVNRVAINIQQCITRKYSNLTRQLKEWEDNNSGNGESLRRLYGNGDVTLSQDSNGFWSISEPNKIISNN
jgi:hypothetical protein